MQPYWRTCLNRNMNSDAVRKGLFKDQALEDELFDIGFIKIPFFTKEEMDELKQFYNGVHPAENIDLKGVLNGIHMTTWSNNLGYKKMVGSFIRNLFDKGIERVFKNHRHLNHVFIAKEAGAKTEFTIHQDWSVVDETKDYSVNIWVPLRDVDKNSGALWVLPKSHNLDQPIRGAGYLFPDYHSDMEHLRDKVKCIDVKEGEALIFFHSTIHGSPPNESTEKRVVTCCTVIHEEADIRTYFQPNESAPLEVYQPDDDFMYGYEDIMNDAPVMPPKGKLVETRESYRTKDIPVEELISLSSINVT